MHPKLQQHPELRRFYQSLWLWVGSGCPPHNTFATDSAICASLSRWLHQNSKLNYYAIDRIYQVHCEVLEEYFHSGRLPFNCSVQHFSKERAKRTLYKNTLRLAWIYKQSR